MMILSVFPHDILANSLFPLMFGVGLVIFHRQNPLVYKFESSAISKVLRIIGDGS